MTWNLQLIGLKDLDNFLQKRLKTPCTLSRGVDERIDDDSAPAEGLPSASRRRSFRMGRRPDNRPVILVLIHKASDVPLA